MEMKVITIPGTAEPQGEPRPKKRDKNNKYAQNLIVRSLRKPKGVEVTAFMMFDPVCENSPKKRVVESIRRVKSCRT
jgi:hypothetical protein